MVMFTLMLAGMSDGGRKNALALVVHVRPSACLVKAMVLFPFVPLYVPPIVIFSHSGEIVTLTAVAAVGTLLMVMSCKSITLRSSPSVTVFVLPSTSDTLALAVIRSVSALPSFNPIAVVVVASSLVGNV